MIPTRLPASSTESSQRAVCMVSPAKAPIPGTSGGLGMLSGPVATTTKRAVTSSPAEVRSRHTCSSSSKAAPSTRVPNRTWRRTSYLSAQWRA